MRGRDNPTTAVGARWSSTTKRVVVVLIALAALYMVYRAGDIVRPFVWAGVLAFVLLPLVGLLERRLSLPRTAAAAVVFLGLLAAIIGGGRLLVPLAVDQLRDLQRSLPTLAANAQNTLVQTADQIGLQDLNAIIVNFAGVSELAQMVARGAVPFIVGLGHFLLELLVFLIATFFLLRDAPRLFQWFRRILPPSQRNELIPLFAQVNTVLGRYVRGQMFLIGVMSTVTFIGLSILQVPFVLLLAIMTGVLEVIPIVGPITAGAIACLVALGHPAPWGLSQIWYVAMVAVMYTVLRHAEDYFVIPLVIGRIVRLHPAVVIFSLLTGGALYGLLGVLIAVPVAATLRLVLIYVGAKLRDEDPFPQLEQELEVPHPAPPAAARTVGRRAHS
jgi:predicted PurR-regulated permease PerM